jgi:hypothetical protein
VLLSGDSIQLSRESNHEQPHNESPAPIATIESAVLTFVTAGFRAYCRRSDQK